MTLLSRSGARRWTLAAIVLLVAARIAQAQGDQSPIPRELVTAALRNYSDVTGAMGNPTVIVGNMPAALVAKMATPPGGRIFGSVVWQGQTDVMGEAPGSIDSVLVWFGRDFAARGYTPAVDGRYAYNGGFRSATVAPATGYCDGQTHYNIRVRGAPANAFLSEFQIHVQANGGECFGGMTAVGERGETGYPRLFNPPTAQMTPRCMGVTNFGGLGGTETAFTTSALPSQLLQHYGRQLDSLGWKRDNTAVPATGAWVRTDSAGDKLRAVLRVLPGTGTASDCRTVMLEITTVGH